MYVFDIPRIGVPKNQPRLISTSVPCAQKASFLHFAFDGSSACQRLTVMRWRNPSLLRGTQYAQHNAECPCIDDRDCRSDPVDGKSAGAHNDSGARARLGTAVAVHAE
jgi:hypothetical protein